MAEEKPKRVIKSKVVIHWNHDKSKFWFQFEDAEGIIFVSGERDTEAQCRADIQRIKKIAKNRFMKIEVYNGE